MFFPDDAVRVAALSEYVDCQVNDLLLRRRLGGVRGCAAELNTEAVAQFSGASVPSSRFELSRR